MSFEAAERLARTLLYEGYCLYPYRPSSLKNRQRWAFGTLYPPAFCAALREGDASALQAECLVEGGAPSVRVAVRCLQLVPSRGQPDDWQEAMERGLGPLEFAVSGLVHAPHVVETEFPGGPSARVTYSAKELAPSLHRLRVRVENVTRASATDRPRALLRALVSTHAVLGCSGGRFLSLADPPPGLEAAAKSCENVGAWPVLVGPPGGGEAMLASPVVLSDHPSVAPESPGDLFDATEIDEILSLRILTLSEKEREEIRASDPRARALLERTEALGEDALLALHGAWRSPSGAGSPALRRGSRVVVRPRPGGDVFDLALAGEPATVTSVEEDLDGRIHYAVTIDRDPGRDLGETGQPGHRFFFSAEELEVMP